MQCDYWSLGNKYDCNVLYKLIMSYAFPPISIPSVFHNKFRVFWGVGQIWFLCFFLGMSPGIPKECFVFYFFVSLLTTLYSPVLTWSVAEADLACSWWASYLMAFQITGPFWFLFKINSWILNVIFTILLSRVFQRATKLCKLQIFTKSESDHDSYCSFILLSKK